MAERSYPVSEVRDGGQEELPHVPKPEARDGGCEELPQPKATGRGREDHPHLRGQGRGLGGPTPRRRSRG